MAKKPQHNLIAALDIGTTKVVAIIGEVNADGQIEAVGMGSHPSTGLKRGMVVNIDSTVQSIKKAIEEAELMAGCKVNSAYTGIAGGHIKSLNSQGIVAIKENEVTQHDIDRVIDAAKAVAIPADQKILHILPQEFIIDNQDGVKEPIGMSGVRLESKVHIVTGGVSAVQNIIKCVERCDIKVSNIILQQFASSLSVLTDDEKELGVCLIDIGGGTTDIAVFTDGAIRHSAVIPIAGDQVTNDVAVAFRTPTRNAEEIKIKYASAVASKVSPEKTFTIQSVTDQQEPRELAQKELAEVVEARYEELFSLVLNRLQQFDFMDSLASGIVLTGGASKMAGVAELAEQIFNIPVRLGAPYSVTGLKQVLQNPIYSTGVGLLLSGFDEHKEGGPEVGTTLWEKMKKWFQHNY